MGEGKNLVQALLLGNTKEIGLETLFLFERTGLIHLFSASGFHMGVALLVSRWAVKPLARIGLRREVQRILGLGFSLGLMTFFGEATSWSSPMVRAYAFSSLLLLAEFWGIRPSKPWLFSVSLLVSALFGNSSPLSFLLSGLGMAGILCAGELTFLSLMLGPWLFTLPVVVWHFHLVSLGAPLWNLIFGSLIGLTVLPLAILDLFFQNLGFHIFGLGAAWLMECFTELLREGDQILETSLWVRREQFFLYFFCFILAAQGKKLRPLAALPFLLFFLWPKIQLAVLDVNQGDALYFVDAQNTRWLSDTGPGGNPVTSALEAIGIAKLQKVMLSHLDLDHVGGTEALLTKHGAEVLLLRKTLLEDPRIFPLLEIAERAQLPLKYLTETPSPSMRCWLPPFSNSNEASPFCHVKLRKDSLWLTGDAGFLAEEWLLQHPIPPAKFLKLGHHGSKFSSSPEFLKATGAKIALVSVGKRNRYGHPTAEALGRAEAAGMKVRRTDREGTIIF